jgi:hypothetical protein
MVMKTQELMIGDWVLWNTHPMKVMMIGSRMVKLYNEDNSIEDDEINPIPLTAEILEKNGFQRCENEWYYFKYDENGKVSLYQGCYSKYNKNGKILLYQVSWDVDDLYLEIASYTSLTGEFNRMGVRFVHELQHALRLCGIEKEIEL